MHWLVPSTIFVIAQSVKDSIRKHSLNHHENFAVLGLEFIFAFIFIFTWTLILKIPIVLDRYTLLFLAQGIIHGLGSTGKVNAVNISLSKTILVSKFVILFPMLLSLIFFKEYEIFHFMSLPGMLRTISLLLFPLILFLMSKPNGDKEDASNGKTWIFSMLQYGLFVGLLVFFNKMFIDSNRVMEATLFQRFGVTVTVLIISWLTKTRWVLTKRFWTLSIIDGFLISLAQPAYLLALSMAPLVIVAPLQKMLTVILTTAAGLFIFHERKKVVAWAKWGYLLSGVGIAMIFIAELLEI
ncbi:MAG: hypothetical protein ABFQ62_00695 [Patescibacteria group bacterium]